jgi:hypothetical protein
MGGNDQCDAFGRRLARQLKELWPAVAKLDTVRQRVVLDMWRNVGVKGLLAMRRFVAAVEFHFWETAAEEILTSSWAEENQRRARVLAEMMRTGLDNAIGPTRPRTA